MTAIERVIATARAEIGYIEKATNSQLEDKTANAGSGNWTKYAAFLDGLGVYNFPKNGYAWCDMFVDWCYITTFGLGVAMKMTKITALPMPTATPLSREQPRYGQLPRYWASTMLLTKMAEMKSSKTLMICLPSSHHRTRSRWRCFRVLPGLCAWPASG